MTLRVAVVLLATALFVGTHAGWAQTTPVAQPSVQALEQRMSQASPDTELKAQATAVQVKQQPLYQAKPDSRQASNWIQRGLTAFGDFLRRLFSSRPPPDVNAPRFEISRALTIIMWVVLAVAVIGGVVIALRHVRWTRRIRAKTIGLMEEDEPDRTADEWLERATALERAGQYREAVRCLYLASLARIDEAGVARFIRSETNWEHLRRIEVSPKRPPALDFRGPTQRFDLVWYGHRVEGSPDVERARRAYEELCQQLGAA